MDTSKTDKAYVHFNNVDQYLRQGFDIRVRGEMVRELIGKPEGIDIIDFGCGDGSISLQFQSPSNKITLVDISENMLTRAGQNINPEYSGNIKRINSDVRSFTTPNKYDVVMGIGLLAHVESVPETLKIMAELLKENGVCILQLTDSTQFFSKLLYIYNRFLDGITGQFGYKRNTLSVSMLNFISKQYDLDCIELKQYSIIFPGFISLLSDKILYRYHSFVRKTPILSSMGTDFILSFKKRKIGPV